ncbi:hypothetical protein [uncultured Aliiroseovarius sp.]|uniref:hypothetical protein n=1 Tax=uncultured Aliiroseovarius sp. TaxID=1658783 RepID=UPI002630E546|nr:hypothetical protein [uncultured Aliiroseovarius sp.]
MNRFKTSVPLESLRKLAVDYQVLRSLQLEELPELNLVAVKVHGPEQRVSDEKLYNEMCEILEHPEMQGWVRFRSEVQWSGSISVKNYRRAGPPVFAEWMDGESQSFQLRLDPLNPGTALIWQYEERQIDETSQLSPAEWPFIKQDTAALGNPKYLPNQMLMYAVYWAGNDTSDPHAVEQTFSRFVGFSNEEIK